MGAARSCYETALEYAKTRIQFDRPIAGFQLTQAKFVDMLLELNKGTLLALHLGRAKDAGRLHPAQVSFGKLNNVREALAIARRGANDPGANGVTLEYPVIRHMNNLESVLTYEGTSEMHRWLSVRRSPAKPPSSDNPRSSLDRNATALIHCPSCGSRRCALYCAPVERNNSTPGPVALRFFEKKQYMKNILGRKVGMTSVFTDDGRYVPVTVIAAGPCTVVSDGRKRSTATRPSLLVSSRVKKKIV